MDSKKPSKTNTKKVGLVSKHVTKKNRQLRKKIKDNTLTVGSYLSALEKRKFLELFSEMPVRGTCCKKLGIGTVRLEQEELNDADFALAIKHAKEQGIDTIEAEAIRRARDGFDEPVFYNGEQCGTKRRYSDTLTTLLLKGNRKKYRNIDATNNSEAGDQVTRMSIAELAKLASQRERRGT